MILVTVSDDRFGRKDGKYGETQNKITRYFREFWADSGIEVHPWKWEDIVKTSFYTDNKVLLDNTDAARNGRAYKPFVILQELLKLENGEYLIYNDCSEEIWGHLDTPDLFDLEIIKELCRNANNILAIFIKWSKDPIPAGELGIATHKNFTTNRCMDKMNLRFYEDAFQCASGMLCIRKTESTVALVKEWLYFNCIDECCSLGRSEIERDESYWKAESTAIFGTPGYKMGHRHDQSILGLLLARQNWKFAAFIYNEMSPANFLQYCRHNQEYELIECLPALAIGDKVENRQGTNMTVFQMENGRYAVGQSEASQYWTNRENLKKVNK